MLRRNSGFRPADAFGVVTGEGVSLLLSHIPAHVALVCDHIAAARLVFLNMVQILKSMWVR